MNNKRIQKAYQGEVGTEKLSEEDKMMILKGHGIIKMGEDEQCKTIYFGIDTYVWRPPWDGGEQWIQSGKAKWGEFICRIKDGRRLGFVMERDKRKPPWQMKVEKE